MDVTIDANTIEEAGLNLYLVNEDWLPKQLYDSTSRTVGAGFLASGELGSNVVISLGGGLIKIDGKNKRIIINDGANDRILIGMDEGGF